MSDIHTSRNKCNISRNELLLFVAFFCKFSYKYNSYNIPIHRTIVLCMGIRHVYECRFNQRNRCVTTVTVATVFTVLEARSIYFKTTSCF